LDQEQEEKNRDKGDDAFDAFCPDKHNQDRQDD